MRDFTYVEDAIEATIAASEVGRPDLEHIGADTPRNGRLSHLFVAVGSGIGASGTNQQTEQDAVRPSRPRGAPASTGHRGSIGALRSSGDRSPSGLSWARAAESVLFAFDGNKASHDEVLQAIRDLALANADSEGRHRPPPAGVARARMCSDEPGMTTDRLLRGASAGIGAGLREAEDHVVEYASRTLVQSTW